MPVGNTFWAPVYPTVVFDHDDVIQPDVPRDACSNKSKTAKKRECRSRSTGKSISELYCTRNTALCLQN